MVIFHPTYTESRYRYHIKSCSVVLLLQFNQLQSSNKLDGVVVVVVVIFLFYRIRSDLQQETWTRCEATEEGEKNINKQLRCIGCSLKTPTFCTRCGAYKKKSIMSHAHTNLCNMRKQLTHSVPSRAFSSIGAC